MYDPNFTPAIPAEIANLQIGDVVEMVNGFSGPIHVAIAGPFSYVLHTDPAIFEALCLKEVGGEYYIDLVTWEPFNNKFTSGSADGALDGYTDEKLEQLKNDALTALKLK